jgi:hypothetical protein
LDQGWLARERSPSGGLGPALRYAVKVMPLITKKSFTSQDAGAGPAHLSDQEIPW